MIAVVRNRRHPANLACNIGLIRKARQATAGYRLDVDYATVDANPVTAAFADHRLSSNGTGIPGRPVAGPTDTLNRNPCRPWDSSSAPSVHRSVALMVRDGTVVIGHHGNADSRFNGDVRLTA